MAEMDQGGYRFGPFTLDGATLELRRGGDSLHLPRQPATLLRLLLRKAGRLVTRAEIQQQCWPETTYGVDPVINAAVRQIRRTLGDSASNPRFVETLPLRGYRFKARVRRLRPGQRRAVSKRLMAGAATVLALLMLQLGDSPSATGFGPETLPEAIRLAYSKANMLLEARDTEQAIQSQELLRQVVSRAPRFAPAWAALAEARFLVGDREGSRQAAREALTRNPDLARAHHFEGMVKLVEDWDFGGAEESLRQAVASAPEKLEYELSLAYTLIAAGKLDEARLLLDEVYAKDPVRFALKADAGWMEYLLGRYERSLELCAAASDLDPNNSWTEDCATMDLLRLGRPDEALARVEAALTRWGLAASDQPWNPDAPAPEKLDAYWAWRAQRLERQGPPGSHYRLATFYARLGRSEDALAALEAGAAERSLEIVVAPAEPAFDPLHGLPRFEALLQRERGRLQTSRELFS